MLRLAGSGLNFCKQRLKHGCHNSFLTSKFEMAETKVKVYKGLYSGCVCIDIYFIKTNPYKHKYSVYVKDILLYYVGQYVGNRLFNN